MLTYVSAGGIIMKPMIIFKCAKVKNEWREAAPSGYLLQKSASGYINAKLFLEYGEEFAQFLKQNHILQGNNKAMILMDMHKSHLFNFEFMKLMQENNVEVCGFPPSCTHLLQPLDDMPFGNFKCKYQKQLLHVNRILSGNRMTKQQFFRVFVPAFQQGLSPEVVRKGFSNTGIYPPDRTAKKLQNLEPSTVYDRCKCLLLDLLFVVRVFIRFQSVLPW